MINYNYLQWCIRNIKRGIYSPLSPEQILSKTHHLRTKGNLTVAEFEWLKIECEALLRKEVNEY